MTKQEEIRIEAKLDKLIELLVVTRDESPEYTSQLIKDLTEKIEVYHAETSEMLQAWRNVKGFGRVLKWALGILLSIGLAIQAMKEFGIQLFTKI